MSLANGPTYTPRLSVPDTGALGQVETANLLNGDLAFDYGTQTYWVLLKDATAVTSTAGGSIATKNSASGASPGRWVQLAGVVGGATTARNVVVSNVADLTAFTITAAALNDNVLNVAGDRVLLVGQSTVAQNGIYVVGTVTGTTAPLTRPADFATGAVSDGYLVRIQAGALFGETDWKLTTVAPITIGTTSLSFYPREVTQRVTLQAGSFIVTNMPILSSVTTGFAFFRTVPNTASGSVIYAPTAAPIAGLLGSGSPSVQVLGQLFSAAINATDVSSGNFTIINW